MPRVRSGFTLIELLVVVAIIVALLAILMPSLNKAIATANTAACASNQRQIATAHLTYATDNMGIHAPASTVVGKPHWLELLKRYTSNIDQVRYCPETDGYRYVANPSAVASVIGSRTATWWLNTNTYGVGFYGGGSYGVNIFTHSTDGWGSPLARHFRSVKETDAPSNIPFLADCVWHNSYPLDTDTAPNSEPAGSFSGVSLLGRYLIRRHQNAVNVAMLDTSVRRVALSDMWTLKWHKGFVFKKNVVVPYLND